MDNQELYIGMRERREAVYEHLLDQLTPLLWTVASAILDTKEDVEECISDVFADLWKRPEQYEPQRGTIKTYLVIKTKSRALDLRRQMARQQAVLQVEELSEAALATSDADMIGSADYQQLYQAVSKLSEPNREILIRRFFLEEKPAHIATRLELPVKEVENRIFRAKQQLKKSLESHKEVLTYGYEKI